MKNMCSHVENVFLQMTPVNLAKVKAKSSKHGHFRFQAFGALS